MLEIYPKGMAGFRRYCELLDTEPTMADRPTPAGADAARRYRYESVTFGYAPERPVLRDVNLRIKAGETVAFVGPSGAGKSTLCSLLPRFYECEAGRITIDGIDIRDMTLASLRRQIGIVQQDVFLFGGTVRENIAYGRLDATEAEIIARRPDRARPGRNDRATCRDGLDTLIGERGVKLSGGQKQRLAIARMFLKNPPILILDEATSALDIGDRAGDPAIAGGAGGGPHQPGHRAPAGDDPQCRPDRGGRRARRRRAGTARRAAGRRRHLPPPARRAVRRVGQERDAVK